MATVLVAAATVLTLIGKALVWFFWTRRIEVRAQRADQRRAASEFSHTIRDYRARWIGFHYDNLNTHDKAPEDEFYWSPSSWEPLLISSELRSLHARLTPKLRRRIFSLEEQVRMASKAVSAGSEYGYMDMDLDGPIFDAEIALQADRVYRTILREANLPAESYEEVDNIEAWLKAAYARRAEAERRQEEVNRAFHAKYQAVNKAREVAALPSSLSPRTPAERVFVLWQRIVASCERLLILFRRRLDI